MEDDLVIGTVPLDSVDALEPFGGVSLDLAMVFLRRSSLKKGIMRWRLPHKDTLHCEL